MPSGKYKNVLLISVLVGGFFVFRSILDPASAAIEKINQPEEQIVKNHTDGSEKTEQANSKADSITRILLFGSIPYLLMTASVAEHYPGAGKALWFVAVLYLLIAFYRYKVAGSLNDFGWLLVIMAQPVFGLLLLGIILFF